MDCFGKNPFSKLNCVCIFHSEDMHIDHLDGDMNKATNAGGNYKDQQMHCFPFFTLSEGGEESEDGRSKIYQERIVKTRKSGEVVKSSYSKSE